MKSRFFLVIVMLLMLGISSFSQVSEQIPISVQAGITVFHGPSETGESFVQFPFSVKRNQFAFIAVDSTEQFKATIYAEVILSDTLGNHLDSASTYYYTFAINRQNSKDGDIKLFNYLSLMIKPGAYKAILNVFDVTNKNEGSFIYDRIEIDSPIPGRLSLSNLELAHDIKIVNESSNVNQSPLDKNGLRIIPNPMGLYSQADSNLFVYAELYNLVYDENVADSFELAFSVYDVNGDLYQDYGTQKIDKPGTTSIITNVINYSGWNTGRYELRLNVSDKASGQTDQVSRKFVIYEKTEQLSDMVSTTIFSPLDTASLETKTNWIRFLVDPSDWVMFKSLNEVGKSEFIAQFFSDNDPTPGDGKNEYLEKVMYHFNFSNEHFSSLPDVNDGWRSDRGRILLQMGPCNKIEDAVVPSQSNPLQIWHYYFVEEGVYFIFQDLDEFGNFRLVHSNKQGERFDNDWEYWIRNNGMESENAIKRGTNKIPDIVIPDGGNPNDPIY